MDKPTTCICGQEIEVPFVNGEYDICNLECPNCHRISTGGNFKTGVVDSWMSRESVNAANRDYQAQLRDADNNEFYGRGNW